MAYRYKRAYELQLNELEPAHKKRVLQSQTEKDVTIKDPLVRQFVLSVIDMAEGDKEL